MTLKQMSCLLIIFSMSFGFVSAQETTTSPFPVFPETLKLGDFLCGLTFWRGLPPCFKETVMHGAFSYYPTREKARIIVESFVDFGMYDQSMLVAFFGSLSTGAYRPVPSVPVGDYWDAAFFGLSKLDHRIEAKRLIMDIIFNRDWAQGKFQDQRYKALDVLSREQIVTLREYEPLVEYLEQEIKNPDPDMKWVNALVRALSNFREWNEELIPIFRQTLEIIKPGTYKDVLQAFLDFDIPDDGEFIMQQIVDAKVQELEDQKLCIRAAYVLDHEITQVMLNDYLKKNSENIDPELEKFIRNSLERLQWFGKWEITDTKETIDPGLKNEKIVLKMTNSLDEKDDIADFSMAMQISWVPGDFRPIGLEDTYETNNVSFVITQEKFFFTIDYPREHLSLTKDFIIREGTGRNEGRIYLKFPIKEEKDRKGNQKYGWIELEKIG